ncbi:MAG: hypothetical protein H7125_12380, partial [Proteobacteria bacterium]|nr:hypothetical protein [Burkholderiales bacterium]
MSVARRRVPRPGGYPSWQRRALLSTGALGACSLVAPPGFAQSAPRVGSDYRIITAQSTPPDRIEVLEFFYYGCPFCQQLEPLLVE